MTGNVGQATLELVANAHAALGEGPVWDEDRGVLWWVDVSVVLVHRFDPAAALTGQRTSDQWRCSDDAG